MRAGVRPGLQILRSRLRRDGRFDSDTLPPYLKGSDWGSHWPVALSYFNDEPEEAQALPTH
jgi:hypothetical protein